MEQTYRIEKCDSKVQWDEYILEHGGHPFQLWGWGAHLVTEGWRVERMFVVEDDTQIGAVQLLVRKLTKPFTACLYVSRGPIVQEGKGQKVYEQLVEYARSNYRAVALIVEPDTVEPTEEYWLNSSYHALPQAVVSLDLGKADGVMLAEMTQSLREQLREAASEDIVVKKLGNPEEIDACLDIHHHGITRSGKTRPVRYYHDLHDSLGEYSVIFGAYEGEKLIAFIWLAVSETVAVELFSGQTEFGDEIHAESALRWHAIRRVKQWGIGRYEVGDLKTAAKRAYSPLIHDYPGTFTLPLSRLYGLWSRVNRLGQLTLK